MKAIQIFEVNRELLEAWGVSEELTWENSFRELIGMALIVDDTLPQGYAVVTPSQFVDQYQWKSNFGTHGWSDIARDPSKPEVPVEKFIYIVWGMNADSWSGIRTMKTIHETLEGAIEAIPEGIRKDELKRKLIEPYVANYTYLAVEKRALIK